MAEHVSRLLNTSALISLILFAALATAPSRAQGARAAEKPGDVAAVAIDARLKTLSREVKPGSSDAQVEEWVRGFLDHLRRNSPIVHERLKNQTLDPDELRSRFVVFLESRATTARPSANGPTVDPQARMAAALAREGDLAKDPAASKELVEKFSNRLAQRSRLAFDALMQGNMSDEELTTRVKSFAGELRSELKASQIDPKTAGLPALIDQFLLANIGQAPERAHAIAFSGSIEQKGKKRLFAIFKKRPNLMRMHIIEEGVVVGLLGFDGTHAWSQSPGQPAVRMVGSAEDDLALMAKFDPPLVDFTGRGAIVDRLEDGADGSIRIRVRESDGSESISNLHPGTLVEQRIEIRRPGGRTEETRCSDHRKVGVLNVAHVQEQWVDGTLQSTTRIDQVNLDGGMINSFFERPRGRSIDFLGYMGMLRAVIAQDKLRSGTATTPSK